MSNHSSGEHLSDPLIEQFNVVDGGLLLGSMGALAIAANSPDTTFGRLAGFLGCVGAGYEFAKAAAIVMLHSNEAQS